jgi:hypothetical protein
MRAVLVVAAQLPWCAVLECATGFERVQQGAPWRLLQGVLHALGYDVEVQAVCPSHCLNGSWVGMHAQPHG